MTYSSFPTEDGEWIPLTRMGEGPPIVMLHGWTSNQLTWLPCTQALAEGYSVYCWTARGHGKGRSQTTNPVTLARMAQDLHNLIMQYDLTKVVLLGHSMGALTVWEYIRQFGCGELAGLCLVDQSPRLLNDDTWKLGIYGHFSFQDNRRFMTELKADFAEAVLQLGAQGNNLHIAKTYQKNTPGIQALRNYLQSLYPAPLIQCWESLTAADYRPVLPTISVPTLLIYGGESQFYSQACARYVQEAIPGSILHTYEGADHFPHAWQKARFIDHVRAFIQDLDR
jgi:pimeloyl-ACP methyl ester carboxylesterase